MKGWQPLIYFELPLELPALPLFVIRGAPLWMWRFLYSVTRRQKLNYAGIAPCETVILKACQPVFLICPEVLFPTSLSVTSGGRSALEFVITCGNTRHWFGGDWRDVCASGSEEGRGEDKKNVFEELGNLLDSVSSNENNLLKAVRRKYTMAVAQVSPFADAYRRWM